MTKILTSIALVFMTQHAFACDHPAPPENLPDGETADKSQMLAGVKMISVYQEKMTEYLSCIEADEIVAIQALDDDDEEGKKKRKSFFAKKYDAAVDEQTLTVEKFNGEIRAYKARPK